MNPDQPEAELPPWEDKPQKPPRAATPPAQPQPQPRAAPQVPGAASPAPRAASPVQGVAPVASTPQAAQMLPQGLPPAASLPQPRTVPVRPGVYGGAAAVQGAHYAPYRHTGLPMLGWGLIGCGGLVFVGTIIAVVVAVFFVDSALSDEVKVAEAKVGLLELNERLRRYYVQNNESAYGFEAGTAPGLDFDTTELEGRYYAAGDYSVWITGSATATIRASGEARGSPDVVMLVTDLARGSFSYTVDGEYDAGPPPPDFRYR